MRKITRDSIDAFLSGRTFGAGNMAVSHHTGVHGAVSSLYLHGHLIAEKVGAGDDYDIALNDCGWFTPTTLSRLNGVLNVHNLPSLIGSVKGAPEIGGEIWEGACKLIVRDGAPVRIESTRDNGDMILVPMRWAA